MNNDWTTCKIGDICKKICSGGTPKSNEPSYYGGNIPWLNTKEINFNRIYNTEKYITSSGFDNSSAKWIDANSVIVALYGATAAKVSINTIPLTTNQACCNLTIDETVADYRYVYYYLRRNYQHLALLANGGAQQNLNAQQIKDFNIILPQLPIQHKIANILWTIDDKIELNRRINDNLEEQAKALFNHYFIQNTENLGEWQDGVLTDIAQYLNGLAMQKYPAMPNEAGLPVLKIKKLGQGQCDTNSDRCSSLIKPEYIISDGTIIFSWSGTLLVDIWCGGKCGLNQHLFKVSSAKYPQWFVFYWTKHHLNKFIRIAKDKAVTMGHIKRCDLEISKVKIPSKQALVNLDKLFSPIFNRMVTCRIENRKLSSLRDTLLPKLMSGEISVEEVSLD